jgi:uncharacterized membrane protein YhaH (DUF805 family)
MDFMTAVKSVYSNYIGFSGRAARSEYWYFVLFYMIVGAVLSVIDTQTGMVSQGGMGVLGTVFGLASLLPSIAVGFRRLHDTGRSAWWFLIAFIPLIGVIVLIVWLASPSQPGDNAYGPNPYGE